MFGQFCFELATGDFKDNHDQPCVLFCFGLDVTVIFEAYGASLQAQVLKDGQAYCGVLHAALIGDGDGPGLEILLCLVEKKLLVETKLMVFY